MGFPIELARHFRFQESDLLFDRVVFRSVLVLGLLLRVTLLTAQSADTLGPSSEGESSAAWMPQVLRTQANVIGQHLPTFHSGGAQVSGVHWGRSEDRFGIAGVRHAIGSLHQEYLAHGGIGFLLGDGALSYGPETIFESHYRAQLGPYLELSPDVQYVRNPGYNRDRGPASVFGLRLNARY